MGNAVRRLYEECCSPSVFEGGHGVSPGTAGFDALARDLFQFESTGQVPEGLSQHVEASKKTQATWYNKIQAAWKEEPPKNPEQAAILIVKALHKHHKVNVEGLLAFYGLPYPTESAQNPEQALQNWPAGVKYELHTLQVDARAIADGDTLTVYVDTRDPRESSQLPASVQKAALERREARTRRDYVRADALQNQIADAGYRVFDGARNGDDILARKYRIRLRGVDAPESKMPYGKEAKEALLSLIEGKSLRVLVYEQDRYARSVGDVYCGNIFVQEVLLKRGFAWHYSQYDQRPEFAKWQKEAQAARVGLWASSNPQKPWEWRKDKREGIPVATFA